MTNEQFEEMNRLLALKREARAREAEALAAYTTAANKFSQARDATMQIASKLQALVDQVFRDSDP